MDTIVVHRRNAPKKYDRITVVVDKIVAYAPADNGSRLYVVGAPCFSLKEDEETIKRLLGK